jgi:hypothetical protein
MDIKDLDSIAPIAKLDPNYEKDGICPNQPIAFAPYTPSLAFNLNKTSPTLQSFQWRNATILIAALPQVISLVPANYITTY